ncbi:hypothetical protein GBA52_001669 [Prunus armeniaca]|nr:hypothetical protein GBA52_001669 [Prunus armeniaca]
MEKEEANTLLETYQELHGLGQSKGEKNRHLSLCFSKHPTKPFTLAAPTPLAPNMPTLLCRLLIDGVSSLRHVLCLLLLLGSSSNLASLSYESTPPPSSQSMTLVLSSSPPTLGLSSRPRLPELRVDSASVFTLNDTHFELIATWDPHPPRRQPLLVFNPASLSYGRLASVFTLNDTRFELIATGTSPSSSPTLGLSSNPRFPELRFDSPPSSHSMTLVLSSSPPRTSPSCAANPNHKLIIYYDSIHATIPTHDYRLAKTSLPPFVLTKRNQMCIGFKSATVREYVNDDMAKGSPMGGIVVKIGVGKDDRGGYNGGMFGTVAVLDDNERLFVPISTRASLTPPKECFWWDHY